MEQFYAALHNKGCVMPPDLPSSADMDKDKIIFEAIAKQRAVRAIYNRTTCILAPHILYARHGDLFVDAVALERGGEPPRERKLGCYKLAGLSSVRLMPDGFEIDSTYDADNVKYLETKLFAV